jgi:membrane protease YdiL (CAAX protease family)
VQYISLVKKNWKVAEFVILFLVLPFFYTFVFRYLPLFPVLFVFYAICMTILLTDSTFDRSTLWWHGFDDWKVVLLRFASVALLIVALVLWFRPDSLLILLRERPYLMAMILIFYPIFSAYPQELVFRTFFYHRYGSLFPNTNIAILINALLFGYAHLIFENWIAVLATVALGVALSSTYLRTRSLLGTSLEHALYGNFAFLIGIGDFFYKIP